MKKIAFFHPVDDKYGASNILAYILRFLADDYICHVYISHENGSIKDTAGLINHPNVTFFSENNLPVIHRGMYSVKGLTTWFFKNLQTYKSLKIKINEYDLIYVNTVTLFSIPIIARILGRKCLIHCHEYLAGTFYGNVIKKCVGKFSTAVISVSQHVNSYISDGKSKFFVVRNGIPDFVTNKIERGNSQENQQIQFSLVGRVMPEKGHWFVLDMLSLLSSETLKTIRINVFGDAPPTRSYLMQEFKDKVKHLGLEDVIIVHGFDPMAAHKIMSMDVCLIPSMMSDPFPTTVLEAIRAGKVVITTNHGGAREVITHGVNGYLVSPGDAEGFKNVVEDVIDKGRDKNIEMGNAARELFVEEYTLDKFQRRFISVLQKILD